MRCVCVGKLCDAVALDYMNRSKNGFHMGAFSICASCQLKKAELKVLDHLAQANTAAEPFPSKGQVCCLCGTFTKRPLSSASTRSRPGHLAIRFANENQPRLVLEPADFI